MITAILLLAIQQQPTGFEAYIDKFSMKKYSVGEQQMDGRYYAYYREETPLKIRLELREYASSSSRFSVLAGIRDSSQRPEGFDSLPRKLPNNIILGFETLHGKNKSWKEDQIHAFGNHCYVIVTISGLLGRTGNPGEVKELEPTPQNTEKLASDIATLFFAEQEAFHFRTSDLRQNGHYFLTLIGPDNSIYLSLNSYGKSVSATFTLNPDTGAGKINSNPPITFNLGSRHYKVGDQEKTAEHIVVLKDGEAYLPQEMLPK